MLMCKESNRDDKEYIKKHIKNDIHPRECNGAKSNVNKRVN